MLRRSFLKGMLLFFSTAAFLFLDKFDSVKLLMAGQLTQTGAKPKLSVSPLRQTIQLNNPSEMVKFVLAQPLQAEQATLADKLEMLKLVRAGCGFQGPAIEQVKREKASFIILKGEENNKANLSYITSGMGKKWIEQTQHSWRNDGLKRIVAKMLAI